MSHDRCHGLVLRPTAGVAGRAGACSASTTARQRGRRRRRAHPPEAAPRQLARPHPHRRPSTRRATWSWPRSTARWSATAGPLGRHHRRRRATTSPAATSIRRGGGAASARAILRAQRGAAAGGRSQPARDRSATAARRLTPTNGGRGRWRWWRATATSRCATSSTWCARPSTRSRCRRCPMGSSCGR